MWEVAGLLFLSSETEEKVRTGVNFFKSSLPYRGSQVGKFFFFCDKDFQYINVLEELFDCIAVIPTGSSLEDFGPQRGLFWKKHTNKVFFFSKKSVFC